MDTRAMTLGAALSTLPGCMDSDDARLALVEIVCDDGCQARWAGTELWSPVYPLAEVLALTAVDTSTLWVCEPDPDVDFCVVVDSHDRVGCYRAEGAWAVSVAPMCATPGEWLFVGLGMTAKASPLL